MELKGFVDKLRSSSGGGKRVQVHIPYPTLLERFEYILKEGINPEIYIDGESLEGFDREDLKEIREALENNGLSTTVHGPYLELNPGSADEETRLKTASRYARAFEAVEYLRPRNIVLHAGYSDRKFHGDQGLWLSQSLKTWPMFVKRAVELNCVIAVENIFDNDPGPLKSLVGSINSTNFGVCLDSGHLNVFSRVDIEEWFKELGPNLAEVHLHDNNGETDDHLPLGEGKIDFKRFLSLVARYAAPGGPVYTIEPHGEEMTRKAIKAVKKYL